MEEQDIFNAKYWNERYAENKFGWDIGSPSTPIQTYIEQLTDKSMKILVPGAGNGHEVSLLHSLGFSEVYLLDWAPLATERFKQKHPSFPSKHVICDDFFKHEAQYDLILEQTFFCALPPAMRKKYVEKMASLIKPGGKLVGLLFKFPLTEQGPPFGGSRGEYQHLFSHSFQINRIETCNNSIPPRKENELFFSLTKPE